MFSRQARTWHLALAFLLGIVWACKYFRPYLYGRKFKIYTDHRPLVWLFNLKEPNSLPPDIVSETIRNLEREPNPKKINIISDIQIRPPTLYRPKATTSKAIPEKDNIFQETVNDTNQTPQSSNTIHSTNANQNHTEKTLLDEIINNKPHQIFDGNKIIHATLPTDISKICFFLKE